MSRLSGLSGAKPRHGTEDSSTAGVRQQRKGGVATGPHLGRRETKLRELRGHGGGYIYDVRDGIVTALSF